MSAPSFEAFVTAQATPLLRTAYLLTGGRRAARDLVQAALVAVHPRFDTLPDGEQAPAVVRELVAAHVGWHTRIRAGDLLTDSPLLAGTRGLPGFATAAPDVGPRDELSTALAVLPPRLRAVLVLRLGTGLSAPDTADALGIAVDDVPGQQALALARLRVLLGGPDRDDADRDAALADRLARELPAHAAGVTADAAETAALAVDGVRSQRHHRAGLLAVLAFLVLVALLVALTV